MELGIHHLCHIFVMVETRSVDLMQI